MKHPIDEAPLEEEPKLSVPFSELIARGFSSMFRTRARRAAPRRVGTHPRSIDGRLRGQRADGSSYTSQPRAARKERARKRSKMAHASRVRNR